MLSISTTCQLGHPHHATEKFSIDTKELFAVYSAVAINDRATIVAQRISKLIEKKAKGVVDIVFLIDVTGSMQSCIDALRENVLAFIESLTTKDANNSCPVRDWRAKVVGYRDYEVDDEPFIDNDFTRDPNQIRAQLSALHADGGGDEPESLLDALYKVSNGGQTEKAAQIEDPRKWRYRSDASRVVIVFTDATYKTSLALPEAKGGTFNDVVNAVTANRIILSIFAPEMDCYDELAAIDKSEYEAIPLEGRTPQEALVAFTADQSNFQNTLKQLAASVSKSAATEIL